MIHPSPITIQKIFDKFITTFINVGDNLTLPLMREINNVYKDMNHRPHLAESKAYIKHVKKTIEKLETLQRLYGSNNNNNNNSSNNDSSSYSSATSDTNNSANNYNMNNHNTTIKKTNNDNTSNNNHKTATLDFTKEIETMKNILNELSPN